MHAPLVLVAASTTAVLLLTPNAPESSDGVGSPARHTRIEGAPRCPTHPVAPQQSVSPQLLCAVLTTRHRVRALERDPLR